MWSGGPAAQPETSEKMKTLIASVCAAAAASAASALGAPANGANASGYAWNKPHAAVVAGGELEYSKAPWAQPALSNPRYVDYVGGNDANDGKSPSSAWRHVPFDRAATGVASVCDAAVDAYVFKRGVTYRGQMSGKIANVRFLSIPDYGTGEAVISGAEAVDPSSWTVGSAPSSMPSPEKVWSAPLGFLPRSVWCRGADGAFVRLALARTPNWTVSNRDDVMAGWWTWQPSWWTDVWKTTVNGRRMHLGIDTDHLKNAGFTESDLVGGLVWSEWGIVMGTPFPSKIEAFDPNAGTIAFQGFWYNDSEKIITGNRYYLEDRPLFLDQGGEFWFDRGAGRLYLRLPGDADPRQTVVEAGSRQFAMDFTSVSNVQITALSFARMNPHWDLEKRPFEHDSIYGSAIRLSGPGVGFTVDHCTFTDVNRALRVMTAKSTDVLTDVVIADNEIDGADQAAMEVAGGMRFDRIDILRNRMREIGRRPARSESGHALSVSWPQRLHLAGNFLSRCYGAGIFVYLGKGSDETRDAPFTRALIHHNRVEDSLLAANDWGGIETWQGGPAYVYGNLSINPGGYWNWARSTDGTSRLGFAYYLDGAFKNYHFNNIARGNCNDLASPLCNRSAVYQATPTVLNAFYNNTYRTFAEGSCWSPTGGRQLFVGNLFDDISRFFFSHGEQKEDAGQNTGTRPMLDTVAYAKNVYAGSPAWFGTLEGGGIPGGLSYEQFNAAARGFPTMGDGPIGTSVGSSVTVGGADLTPRAGSAAIDAGARPFVPWALKRTVGEWNFRRGAPGLDEHWYMSPSVVDRNSYWKLPRNDLQMPAGAVSASAESEDWIDSAVSFGSRPARLPAPEGLLPAVRGAAASGDRVTLRLSDWAEMDAPACPKLGARESFRVTMKNVPASWVGQQLCVDVHWHNAAGGGGWLTGSFPRQTIAGSGTYETPISIPATLDPTFASYMMLVYITPDGSWDRQHTQASATLVPKDGLSPEELAALDPAPQFDVPHAVGYHNLTVEAIAAAARPNCTVASTLGTGFPGGLVVRLSGPGDSRPAPGYALYVDGRGRPAFRLQAGGASATAQGSASVCDGRERHYLAELDRDSRRLRLYVDGGLSAETAITEAMAEADATTWNTLRVGSNLTLDFLRIALSSLAESKTDIDELRAWEFDGPFLRDFSGRAPSGRRDAGAIER